MSFISWFLVPILLLAILVSDFFGFHRRDVLYLSSAVYFLVLPAIAIVAVSASALVLVTRVTNETADGKELVQRRLEPMRWALWVAVRAVGFGLAITLGTYYFIGMAVSYTSRTPIHIDSVPTRVWEPKRRARGCRQFAVVTVSPLFDSYICTHRAFGSAHARLSSIGGSTKGEAAIDGRSGFLGAVADTVSMQQSSIR